MGTQQVGAQHQLFLLQEVAEGQLARFQQTTRLRVVTGVGHHRILGGSGEQHAALLEGLAHGREHQRTGLRLADTEPLGPPGHVRSGPPHLGVRVGSVDTAAGEDGHAAGEVHADDTTLQEHLDAARRVPHEHHGGRVADGYRGGIEGGCRAIVGHGLNLTDRSRHHPTRSHRRCRPAWRVRRAKNRSSTLSSEMD